jgi:hypothetical protein
MTFVVKFTDRSDLRGGHMGIAEDMLGLGKALVLHPSCLLYALANLGRGFPVGRRRQFPVMDRWDVDMNVNPIQ